MTFEGTKHADLISQLCELIVDTKLYSKVYAHEHIPLLISHEFIHNQLNFTETNSGGLFGTWFQGSQTPIMKHFSTHQEQLGPLMVALGFDQFNYRRVEPGSSLFVELSKNNVSLNFMKTHDELLVNITYSISDFQNLISKQYKQFKTIFKEEVKDICNVDYIEFLEK